MQEKCFKGWSTGDGSCCCNCRYQKKLMDRIEINKQIGFVCTVEFDDESNKNEYYLNSEHGICEFYVNKDFKLK